MRNRHDQRGQELAELGIIIVLLVLLAGGVIQFGHAFMVANMITHAARDGARLAASWTSRGLCGQITNTADIQTAVTNRIATVTDQTCTVAVSQNPPVDAAAAPPNCPASSTTPSVVVTVNNCCIPYIINILGFSSGCSGGFAVSRSVVFDDELRATFGG